MVTGNNIFFLHQEVGILENAINLQVTSFIDTNWGEKIINEPVMSDCQGTLEDTLRHQS